MSLIVTILLSLLGLTSLARAQETPADSLRTVDSFSSRVNVLDAPYAGRYEARIGGSREFSNNKLRLDIGAAIDLLSREYRRPDSTGRLHAASRISFGADFFTWTRLRSTADFKFPVEAVDYYFGVRSNYSFPFPLIARADDAEIRLRIAHISAHLVDGDTSFTSPDQQYFTYSREFVDAMFAARHAYGSFLGSGTPYSVRVYAGLLALFHTIPSGLGVITPYWGDDLAVEVSRSFPVVVKFGMEYRLNFERQPLPEMLTRLGLKLGRLDSRGVVVEGSYYLGRSQYGQHYNQHERYFSLGFAVDY